MACHIFWKLVETDIQRTLFRACGKAAEPMNVGIKVSVLLENIKS